jgi:hypothetical protein
MSRPVLHLILHVLVPGAVARLAFSDRWRRAWLIMLLAMVVDLDHLLATPIYDPNRCGIGFHPLHSYVAIGVYGILALIPTSRVAGVGLLIHMLLDGIDCVFMP